jgi:hypothetical protein
VFPQLFVTLFIGPIASVRRFFRTQTDAAEAQRAE